MILTEDKAPVYGLVLAGGKSMRMGTDKGSIVWHVKKQRYHLADLLSHFCDHVFISCRKEQSDEIVDDGYRIIEDSVTGLASYGAMLSAFHFRSDVAWFVLACDLPLMNRFSLEQLISERDTTKIATTFRSPHDSLPEPLVTIWEPRSYQLLLSGQSEGKTCPRKVLLNTDIKIIDPLSGDALINANTPEDMERVKQILSNEKRVAEI